MTTVYTKEEVTTIEKLELKECNELDQGKLQQVEKSSDFKIKVT